MNTSGFSPATCAILWLKGRLVKNTTPRRACSQRCREDEEHSLKHNLAQEIGFVAG